MRYLVLSDVHANAYALEAVLAHAKKKVWDEVMFLGDAVGYYTRPQRAIDLLVELDPMVRIMGNHDALLLAMVDGATLDLREDSVVREALARNLEEITDDGIAFLRGLEPHRVNTTWEATHGALRHRWEYLTSVQAAQANLGQMEAKVCLVGHTHVPKVFASVTAAGRELWRTVAFKRDSQLYRIPPKAKAFLNPGSVGQPRDGIPAAAYALFDSEAMTFEVIRVGYEVAKLQREVRELGFPDTLAERLPAGR
jgi:predicted phosphodiesterase